MAAPLVQLSALTRHFDGRVAVDGVSLSVAGGEVLSLLGPNGAGKTTTFRMLAGLLLPTSGRAEVAGAAASPEGADAVRGRVGLLTEAPGLWERLSVRWNLRTYAELYGLPDVDRVVGAAMARLGLEDRADDRTGTLSKGLKQRVAIARALLHDPPVVLLDEPTAGLDPGSARGVRDLVRAIAGEGRAVLVSTHNLAEAEEISDRMAVLNTSLLACDTPGRLRAAAGGGVTAVIEVEGPAAAWVEAARQAGAEAVLADAAVLTLDLPSAGSVPDIVAALVGAGARVRRVEPRQPSLEAVYLALTRQDD